MHYRINICTFAILTDIWKLYENLIFQRIQLWSLNCICILQSVTIHFGTPHEFLGGPWAQLTCITWFTGLVGRHRAELHETGAFPRPRAGGHGEMQECPKRSSAHGRAPQSSFVLDREIGSAECMHERKIAIGWHFWTLVRDDVNGRVKEAKPLGYRCAAPVRRMIVLERELSATLFIAAHGELLPQ
jgi:hypothetical protein